MIKYEKNIYRLICIYHKLVICFIEKNIIKEKIVNKLTKKFELSYYDILIILKDIKKDFEFFKVSDLSLKTDSEILTLNTFKAIIYYRFSHLLYKNQNYLASRIISEYSHRFTQIDIHPGAIIFSPFYIDHGTGVVVGETCIIGKYVKLYHGVTLGAKLTPDENRFKRHPTIEDNVTIYCNSSIFGDIRIFRNTIIKAHSIIK